MASRILKLKRPDPCIACGTILAAGDQAWWDAEAKAVWCRECHRSSEAFPTNADVADLDRGQAGASARREYERRKTKREKTTRDAHPHIGGLLLRWLDAPQHEQAFNTGAKGERDVGGSLEQRTNDGDAIILHDRRMPVGKGNIDHLAIAPTGVFVIDAKAHSGKVRVDNPLFGQTKLKIAGRDRTPLIAGLDRQVAAVRAVLDLTGHANVPIQGVLCFTDAELPLFGKLTMRGHVLLRRKQLAKRLNADGPLGPEEIAGIAHELAQALPAA